MIKFLYKLFRLEYEEPYCRTCEYLKMLVEIERREKSELLKRLVDPPVKEESTPIPQNLNPIGSSKQSWQTFKSQLERADYLKAQNERENKIAALEAELNVTNG